MTTSQRENAVTTQQPATTDAVEVARPSLRELLRFFLGLGAAGFGGPIALVGYREREFVEEPEEDMSTGLRSSEQRSCTTPCTRHCSERKHDDDSPFTFSDRAKSGGQREEYAMRSRTPMMSSWGRRAPSAATLVLCGLSLIAMAACGDKKSKDDDDDDDDQPVSKSPSAETAAPASAPNAAAGVARGDSSSAAGAAQLSGTTRWNFDSATTDQPPAGFSFARTGSGRPGRWVVRAAADAPSGPNVLAQEDSDRTDYRFPVAVADAPTFADVSVSVRCKPVGGRVDRACGIVWRYQDENNYYLTRANALEDNVCWYYVQNGRRIEVKRVHLKVVADVWHTLRADMRGDHVEVYFNDKKLIDVHDSRFTAPGKVGVWTKADSRTLFDDLTATALKP